MFDKGMVQSVVSVLEAIQFFDDAWKNVTQQMIIKCVREAQITKSHLFSDEIEENGNNFPITKWIKQFNVNKYGN